LVLFFTGKRVSPHRRPLSLEIIDATNFHPSKEHLHNEGKTWAEGKNGDEFTIRITSHKKRTCVLANPILIDGSHVGHVFQQGPAINLTATLGPVAGSDATGKKLLSLFWSDAKRH
jgi:hypothetical protein